MSDVSLPITPGNLPPNYCFTSWQKLAVDLAAIFFAKLTGQAFYNVGATKPDVQFNSYPWLNTSDGRWYTFSGEWISKHPWQQATSAGLRLEWEGIEADLGLFDGGDADPASDRSGPMWEIDHAYDGRSSMGVGAVPSSTPAKNLALSEDYGTGTHLQIATEVAPHTHVLTINGQALGGTGQPPKVVVDDDVAVSATDANGGTAEQNNVGTQTEIPLVHPVRGCYKIKRSARIYYRVP